MPPPLPTPVPASLPAQLPGYMHPPLWKHPQGALATMGQRRAGVHTKPHSSNATDTDTTATPQVTVAGAREAADAHMPIACSFHQVAHSPPTLLLLPAYSPNPNPPYSPAPHRAHSKDQKTKRPTRARGIRQDCTRRWHVRLIDLIFVVSPDSREREGGG